MPLIEKDLADALVHYRYEQFKGADGVPVEKHRTLLRKWYEAEHGADPSDPILAQIGNQQAAAARGTGNVLIADHIAVLERWLEREMARRLEAHRSSAVVLEGTDEFNRGHRAAVGS